MGWGKMRRSLSRPDPSGVSVTTYAPVGLTRMTLTRIMLDVLQYVRVRRDDALDLEVQVREGRDEGRVDGPGLTFGRPLGGEGQVPGVRAGDGARGRAVEVRPEFAVREGEDVRLFDAIHWVLLRDELEVAGGAQVERRPVPEREPHRGHVPIGHKTGGDEPRGQAGPRMGQGEPLRPREFEVPFPVGRGQEGG